MVYLLAFYFELWSKWFHQFWALVNLLNVYKYNIFTLLFLPNLTHLIFKVSNSSYEWFNLKIMLKLRMESEY